MENNNYGRRDKNFPNVNLLFFIRFSFSKHYIDHAFQTIYWYKTDTVSEMVSLILLSNIRKTLCNERKVDYLIVSVTLFTAVADNMVLSSISSPAMEAEMNVTVDPAIIDFRTIDAKSDFL
jgi:hypothetical protein